MADNQTRPSEPAIFVVSISVLSRSAYNNTDINQDDVDIEDNVVFGMDPSLLIDPDKVAIGQKIAEGSESVVHEGWFESKPVAIKVMTARRALSATTENKERLQGEFHMPSKTLTFVGVSVDPMMVLLTKRVKGGSLHQHLKDVYPRTLDLELSLSFALDISRAMEYLHATGIMHRDLNTGNLLLTEDKKHVLVADFGLARVEAIDKMMTPEAGTYRWMAPEVMSKEPLLKGEKKRYDHKADVYSFAFVLWSLLTNRKPFGGMPGILAAYVAAAKNMRPNLEEIPEDIVPLIQSCWAEDPMKRPEFVEITEALKNTFQKRFPIANPPPCNLTETENGHNQGQGECITAQTPDPYSVVNEAKEKRKEKKKKLRGLFSNFFRCFRT